MVKDKKRMQAAFCWKTRHKETRDYDMKDLEWLKSQRPTPNATFQTMDSFMHLTGNAALFPFSNYGNNIRLALFLKMLLPCLANSTNEMRFKLASQSASRLTDGQRLLISEKKITTKITNYFMTFRCRIKVVFSAVAKYCTLI